MCLREKYMRLKNLIVPSYAAYDRDILVLLLPSESHILVIEKSFEFMIESTVEFRLYFYKLSFIYIELKKNRVKTPKKSKKN